MKIMIRKEQGGGIQAGGKGAGSLWWTVIVNSVLIRVWRQGQLAQKNVHNLGNENMITFQEWLSTCWYIQKPLRQS